MKVDDYILNRVLDKIKEIIHFEKFDAIKILINADDKFSDDIGWSYRLFILEKL